MIFYDLEVFKEDWLISWLDTETKKMYTLHNDKERLEDFYEHYKDRVWVGYNSRRYDTYIVKAILAGFNPYDISQWMIEEGRHGWEYSRLLNRFPILNYDCAVGFRGLKELEAFMGHDIQETSVSFDIDRPLTHKELLEVKEYNRYDVSETFHVFIETKHEFESHLSLIDEFNLPPYMIGRTKAQISADILGANPVERDDEFEIILPDNLELGKYEYIRQHFLDWGESAVDEEAYKEVRLSTEVAGVPHVVAIGGLHGARRNYFGDGYYILADVTSYYPFSMVMYDYLSRNVSNPKLFETMLHERLEMKAAGDPRENPRKIVLNSTFGASKDKYNKLYDPRQANNLCIANQLFLIDLLEKLEGHCEIIQSNTDGILMKLYSKDDEDKIKGICKEWEDRTGFHMDYDKYTRVIQRDVNNYIMVAEDGYLERKGAVVKDLSPLDNDLPIVNKAVVDYFVYDIPVEETIMNANDLIDYQKITKISGKYDYGFHERPNGDYHNIKGNVYYGDVLSEKVIRCFASTNPNDGTIYKKHKDKDTLDKTASTPEQAFINNGDINGEKIPPHLDKQWYVELAQRRCKEFIGGK